MTANNLKSISKMLTILGITTFIIWSISGIMDLVNNTEYINSINSLTLTTISLIFILLSKVFLQLHKIEVRHENDKNDN